MYFSLLLVEIKPDLNIFSSHIFLETISSWVWKVTLIVCLSFMFLLASLNLLWLYVTENLVVIPRPRTPDDDQAEAER